MKIMQIPKLIYQTPKLYKYGGIYLKIGHKRYRLIKIGEH